MLDEGQDKGEHKGAAQGGAKQQTKGHITRVPSRSGSPEWKSDYVCFGRTDRSTNIKIPFECFS